MVRHTLIHRSLGTRSVARVPAVTRLKNLMVFPTVTKVDQEGCEGDLAVAIDAISVEVVVFLGLDGIRYRRRTLLTSLKRGCNTSEPQH